MNSNFFYLNRIIKNYDASSVDIMFNMSVDVISTSLHNAVRKRVTTSDRKIACLLSGGLDSSIITALVNKYYDGQLETYSIGLSGSDDLKYAKIVSQFLNTTHTEIVVTEDEMFDMIPEVIQAIESYDTTTVRASVGNYLVAKYIKEHSNAKVIFNGDGADELMGGYLYFHCSPDKYEFNKECQRILEDIHYFDVLRSDKSISSNGLEPRTPFLDKQFVQDYLNIPVSIRSNCYNNEDRPEKYILRTIAQNEKLLPNEITWRRKEAFSDGVSGSKKSWYEIIQDKLLTINKITPLPTVEYGHNPPATLEQKYYRAIFEKNFPNMGKSIPYFWMPRFIKATDASARTLDIY